MSLPFRSKEQSSSRRKNRPVHLEATQLEERKLPAPVVDITTPVPTITSTSTGTNTVTITAWMNPSGPQLANDGVVFCRSGTTVWRG